MAEALPARIRTLDLIRGIAVLGILTVNIAGFAGTTASTLTPHLPHAGSWADAFTFAAIFVVFEGKMRLLFTLLFGASMLLFIERADAQGRDGAALQLRRLGLLAVFGYLHYALLWWGDILLIYAVLGLVALAFREMEIKRLVIAALAFYLVWHLIGMASTWSDLVHDVAVQNGSASAKQLAAHNQNLGALADQATRELATYQLGWLGQIRAKLFDGTFAPFQIALSSIGETVPTMLLGMALYRSGFFAGAWPDRYLRLIAFWGLLLGAALSAGLIAHAWQIGFAVPTMFAYILYWGAVPHLLMVLGYAALLIRIAPRLIGTLLGRRLEAAGRMAFSNYIGTSVLMCAIFYGWGLGLVGQIGHAGQILLVLLGWVVMLGWSTPWLARFHQGPLEWIWRSLTEWQVQPFVRRWTSAVHM